MVPVRFFAYCRRLLDAQRRACGTGPIVVLLTLQLLSALTAGASLALIVPAVQAIQGTGRIMLPVVGATVSYVVVLGAIVLTVALQAALQWWGAVQASSVRLRSIDYLRLRALNGLLHARWGYLSQQRRSHLVQSLTTEVYRSGAAIDQLTQLIVSALTVSVTAALIVLLSPPVGFAALLVAGGMGAASIRNIRRAGQLGSALSERVQAFGAVVTDSLACARMVRAHDAADAWITALTREASRGRDVQMQHVRSSAGITAGLAVASAVGAAVLIISGFTLGVQTAILLALVVAVNRLLSATQSLVQRMQLLANLAPALDHVESVTRDSLHHRESHREPVTALESRPNRPIVSVDSVSVSYDGSPQQALDSVSFQIPRGTITAILGPSGAGKSTLLDVILGLREPSQGSVTVEGRPLAADVLGWRARTAYVPQQVVLIPGSVRDNLTWSLAKDALVTDDDLWSALDSAAISNVIRTLPAGLDTPLGEESRLSGGENQRISLARALLRQPELLVLDEVTSALDEETEAQILGELQARGGSVLLVTHRTSVAARAQLILQLRHGRVASVMGAPH